MTFYHRNNLNGYLVDIHSFNKESRIFNLYCRIVLLFQQKNRLSLIRFKMQFLAHKNPGILNLYHTLTLFSYRLTFILFHFGRISKLEHAWDHSIFSSGTVGLIVSMYSINSIYSIKMN